METVRKTTPLDLMRRLHILEERVSTMAPADQETLAEIVSLISRLYRITFIGSQLEGTIPPEGSEPTVQYFFDEIFPQSLVTLVFGNQFEMPARIEELSTAYPPSSIYDKMLEGAAQTGSLASDIFGTESPMSPTENPWRAAINDEPFANTDGLMYFLFGDVSTLQSIVDTPMIGSFAERISSLETQASYLEGQLDLKASQTYVESLADALVNLSSRVSDLESAS